MNDGYKYKLKESKIVYIDNTDHKVIAENRKYLHKMIIKCTNCKNKIKKFEPNIETAIILWNTYPFGYCDKCNSGTLIARKSRTVIDYIFIIFRWLKN